MDSSNLAVNIKEKNSRPKTCNSDHLFPQLPTISCNKYPVFSSASARTPSKSPRLRSSLTVHSQRSKRSSLSSRTSSSGVSSSSGGSGLERKQSETNLGDSDLSRSIDSETLAIAIELSKLKARREKDHQETFARIMDVTGDVDIRPNVLTPVTARSNISSAPNPPPPSTVYRGPGVSGYRFPQLSVIVIHST